MAWSRVMVRLKSGSVSMFKWLCKCCETVTLFYVEYT